jgi:hypothetical protein
MNQKSEGQKRRSLGADLPPQLLFLCSVRFKNLRKEVNGPYVKNVRVEKKR